MSLSTFLLLVLAGIGAGLVGYLAGLASLVSYPALLAVGLPPVVANATNTLALVGAGFGTMGSAGAEFLQRGRRTTIVESLIALIGGLLGGWLLVATGEASFSSIVPWLVLIASVLLFFSPRLGNLRGPGSLPRSVYYGALFVVCIYGGYFGAGSGVIYMAVAVLLSGMSFHESVLVKAILLALSNLSAGLLFVLTVPIDWWAVLAMGIGSAVGGYVGPLVQRMFPESALRWVIALSGIALAAWLWIHR